METIREKILEADKEIKVKDVVNAKVLSRLPLRLRKSFSKKIIKWRDDREIWGLEFGFGEKYIELGHFMGHHIATRPDYYGMEDDSAEWIIVREVEGVLLHELGHAIYALALRTLGALSSSWRAALDADGWPSSYGDEIEEGVAEAVRYFLIAPKLFSQDFPRQAILVRRMIREAEKELR